MINAFQTYLLFFKRYLGQRIYIVLIFTFTAALAESIGILLFIPVIGQFGVSADIIAPDGMFSNTLLKVFSFFDIEYSLKNTLLLIVLSFAIKGALIFGSYVYSARLRGHLLYVLKYNILTGIQNMQYSDFQTKDSGTLSALVNEQVTKVILTFNFFLHFATHVLTSILYITAGMLASPILGVFGACMATIVLLLFRKLSQNLKDISLRNSLLTNRITQTAIEGLHNYKYLKSTNMFANFNQKIMFFMAELKKLNIYNGIAEGFVISVREPILALTLCIILYIQVGVLESSIARSLVAMLLFYRGMNSVFNSQRTWQNLLEHSGSVDLIDGQLKNFADQSELSNNGIELTDTWFDIVFDNVTYQPPLQDKVVLSDVSFTIKRNSLTVIMGASGSGKTTLVDLLMGLLQPTNGSVTIGEINTKFINLASLRRRIGYVSQDTVAFSDTVASNVSSWNIFSDTDETLINRMGDACQKAGILDVIAELKQGFQTELGDRGTTFSGGQRQRLFLARELYREPEILILDEPTSALDTNTEKLVFDTITALKGKTTIICITHRQSLAEKADTIIQLKKGL